MLFALQMTSESHRSLDLIHKDDSLTSSERIRLEKRLEDDWVLTDEERQKINDRLQADNQRRERLGSFLSWFLPIFFSISVSVSATFYPASSLFVRPSVFLSVHLSRTNPYGEK